MLFPFYTRIDNLFSSKAPKPLDMDSISFIFVDLYDLASYAICFVILRFIIIIFLYIFGPNLCKSTF